MKKYIALTIIGFTILLKSNAQMPEYHDFRSTQCDGGHINSCINYYSEKTSIYPQDTFVFKPVYVLSCFNGLCYDFIDTMRYRLRFGAGIPGTNNNFSQYYFAYGEQTVNITVGDTIKPEFRIPVSEMNLNGGNYFALGVFADYLRPQELYGGSDSLQGEILVHTGNCEATFSLVKDTVTPGLYYVYSQTVGNNLSYLWHFGDGDSSTLQYPSHTYTSAGYYTISLTVNDNSSGCSFTYRMPYTDIRYKNEDVQIQLVVQGPTKINEENVEPSITVYPNPALNEIYFNSVENIKSFRIYNLEGKKLIEFDAPRSNTVDIKTLTKGTYIAEIVGDGFVIHRKWVKM